MLRSEQEAILTILEVFLHDPLYRWTLSSLAALKRQLAPDQQQLEVDSGSLSSEAGDASTDAASIGNAPAARALLRLKAKIQGVEYGQALSVEGQVNQLINEAQDPERLCKMYKGWAPWV